MKLLTIVIPSYNSADFIDKNMKTLIDKRLFKNVEVLLINDGSNDCTADKAVVYENNYPDFVRFIDKENGGHGSVINCGIQKATGKYFKVIDADDWVDTENLVKLVEILQKCKSDLVLNPYIKIHEKTNEMLICPEFSALPKGQYIMFNKAIRQGVLLTLHSVTIKTELLRKNNIRMTEKCFYEDFQFTLYMIPYIKSVTVLDFPVYYYLVGQKSQSVNAASCLKNINMYIKVFEDAVLYLEDIWDGLERERREYMEICMCAYLRSMYNIFLRNGGSKEVVHKMIEADSQVSRISPRFYDMVGKKNIYIQLMRCRKVVVFQFLSMVFKIYKKRKY